MTKAFIFDMDGTLLDSMPVWYNVCDEYALAKGKPENMPDISDIIKPLTLSEASKYIGKILNIPPQTVFDEITEIVYAKYKYDILPKPGVIEFLEKNKHRNMCVATATDRPIVEHVLTRLDMLKYFKFIITSAEGGSKQRPDIFIKAAQMLGTDPNGAIVFEDALHAIKSAKSAGFYTVAVHEPCFMCDYDEIIRVADCYVNNMNEFEVPN